MSLKSQIESILFIAAKPISAKQLSELLKKTIEEINQAGGELIEEYKQTARGLQIIKNGSQFQMVSSPENTEVVQEFVKEEVTGELSRPSLETLTIIAYRGPVAKYNLDRIRGVNCSLILRNLLLRGLVEAKVDKVKNETMYNITFDFIRFLGVNDVKELPDYERLSQDDTIDRVLEGVNTKEDEQAQIIILNN
jgi:segregation and condensation protein B